MENAQVIFQRKKPDIASGFFVFSMDVTLQRTDTASGVAFDALACEVGCKREGRCETDWRAVRDDFVEGLLG